MPVYRCVVENTWDCEPQHREAVENVWHDLYAVSMEMCRMGEYKMPEPLKCDAMNPKVKHMCDMPQALSCITSMQAKVMKGEGDICRYVFYLISEFSLSFSFVRNIQMLVTNKFSGLPTDILNGIL